jgi:hypothetical protein
MRRKRVGLWVLRVVKVKMQTYINVMKLKFVTHMQFVEVSKLAQQKLIYE